MTQDFYSMDIKCRNCKRPNWIKNIPYGTEVDDHLEKENSRCEICKCLLFMPKPTKEEKPEKEVQDNEKKEN